MHLEFRIRPIFLQAKRLYEEVETEEDNMFSLLWIGHKVASRRDVISGNHLSPRPCSFLFFFFFLFFFSRWHIRLAHSWPSPSVLGRGICIRRVTRKEGGGCDQNHWKKKHWGIWYGEEIREYWNWIALLAVMKMPVVEAINLSSCIPSDKLASHERVGGRIRKSHCFLSTRFNAVAN